MIDLTGENLSSYLLREIRDLVNRNPRFRNLGGDVTVHTNTMVAWGDLRVTIDSIASEGTRLSSDYFMSTQYGRAVLCKLENADGLFIEWVQELKNKSTFPKSGIYYLNVDSVDESTREVGLTVQQYRWVNASSSYATGSLVYFAPGINVASVVPVDPTIQYTLQGNNIAINSFSNNLLQLKIGSNHLVPMTDFWYQRNQEEVITTSTVLGVQSINLPIANYLSMSIVDQDDYTLVLNKDYVMEGPGRISTSAWTPANSTLTATFIVKADPSQVLAAHPENNIATLAPDELLATGETTFYSSSGNLYSDSDFTNINGAIWLNTLLNTGDFYSWQTKMNEGQFTVSAHKLAINKDIIPGLSIAIGDQVFVGDQCAILVSPTNSEVYEIYGSKDNISFDIKVKANDRMTASEISEVIKSYLLVNGRNRMETAGITIFEISKNSETDARDSSSTAPSTTYTLGVSGMADWEVRVPLVTRIAQFSIDVSEDLAVSDFPGKATPLSRITAFGNSRFLPYYS